MARVHRRISGGRSIRSISSWSRLSWRISRPTSIARSPEVAFAITITLMLRPLGARLFGMFADKYGRRGPLMASVLIYSVIVLITAFSPNFAISIVLRGLYRIAMGGEWGVGAALALETLPAKSARRRLRHFATGICDRLSGRRRRVRALLHHDRLARHVPRRCAAGATRPLHPLASERIAGVERPPIEADRRTAQPWTSFLFLKQPNQTARVRSARWRSSPSSPTACSFRCSCSRRSGRKSAASPSRERRAPPRNGARWTRTQNPRSRSHARP